MTFPVFLPRRECSTRNNNRFATRRIFPYRFGYDSQLYEWEMILRVDRGERDFSQLLAKNFILNFFWETRKRRRSVEEEECLVHRGWNFYPTINSKKGETRKEGKLVDYKGVLEIVGTTSSTFSIVLKTFRWNSRESWIYIDGTSDKTRYNEISARSHFSYLSNTYFAMSNAIFTLRFFHFTIQKGSPNLSKSYLVGEIPVDYTPPRYFFSRFKSLRSIPIRHFLEKEEFESMMQIDAFRPVTGERSREGASKCANVRVQREGEIWNGRGNCRRCSKPSISSRRPRYARSRSLEQTDDVNVEYRGCPANQVLRLRLTANIDARD